MGFCYLELVVLALLLVLGFWSVCIAWEASVEAFVLWRGVGSEREALCGRVGGMWWGSGLRGCACC